MKRLITLLFCLLPTLAIAQQEMEIIPLKNRTVDQVMPVIRPLYKLMLPPAATPSGALMACNPH